MISHALSAQQLLTGSVASQESYINMWDLEVFMNRKWFSMGLRIQTDSIARKPFQICKKRWCFNVKTLIVDQEVVSSNSINCRWARIFHIELGLKIRVYVLRCWLWLVIAPVLDLKRIADVLDRHTIHIQDIAYAHPAQNNLSDYLG